MMEFLARIIGWSDVSNTRLAFRQTGLARDHMIPLVLSGYEDLVPIAFALHQRSLGSAAPFAVCDPRRRNAPANARCARSYASCADAIAKTAGGTVVLYSYRLPNDFESQRENLSYLHRIFILKSPLVSVAPYHLKPIVIPRLSSRHGELALIASGYADDVGGLCADDVAWLAARCSRCHGDMIKGAARIAAVRKTGALQPAADLLAMSSVSLARWLGHRGITVSRRLLPDPVVAGSRAGEPNGAPHLASCGTVAAAAQEARS